MNTDEELKSMLGGNTLPEMDRSNDRIVRGMKRTRTSLGQQYTLSFILIKLWVIAAKILAPFFASIVKKQAESSSSHAQKTHPQYKISKHLKGEKE